MTCFYCGATIDPKTANTELRYTVDHIYPSSMLRSLTREQRRKLPKNFGDLNRVDCCSKCNGYKGHLHPLDWLLIMPNAHNAARLAERMVRMGEDMEEVFDALQRRRK